jgi:uncharacterized protein (TIGR03083 family)
MVTCVKSGLPVKVRGLTVNCMPPSDAIAYYERSALRIIDLASQRRAETVSSCPEWNGRDLIEHIGLESIGWRQIMETPMGGVPQTDMAALKEQVPGDDSALILWARESVGSFASGIGTLDPATPAWSFTEDKTLGFWIRRSSVEVALHLWDAEGWESGPRSHMPPMLAADGLDELADSFPILLAMTGSSPERPLAINATDPDGQWVMRGPEPGLATPAEVGGTASDVLLRLWGRDTGTFTGDVGALEEWARVNPMRLAEAYDESADNG